MRLPLLVLCLLSGCGAPATDETIVRASSFDPGARPIGPVPGEVTVWQLELPAGFPPKSGEAAILVGPDGNLVAIDVGGENHDDEVREAIRELNTVWLTPERGFPARAPLQLEWVVITHWHADHMRGFLPLITGPDPVQITKGVVHRGFVDVGKGLNDTDFEDACTVLRGDLASKNFGLCTAPVESPCHVGGERFRATSCPGLTLGDLGTGSDDSAGDPSFIDLGDGARLELLAAGAFALQGRTPVAAAAFGVDDVNEENARSVVGLVRHGAFRFLFAGDLTGSGKPGEPDIESFVVNSAPQVFGDDGIDVTHANHHVRDTSSNTNWVEACAPIDGRTRSVIGGVNSARWDSPQQRTIDAWTERGRLAAGKLFVTRRGALGGSGPGLVDVNGRVVVQTVQHGGGYWVQDLVAPAVRRTEVPAAFTR